MEMRNASRSRYEVSGSAPARAKSLGVHHRSEVHSRRVRHPDPLRETEQRAGDVAHENGYKLPNGAASVLGSYIRQNMHFFVAKVNLGEQAGSASTISVRCRSRTSRRKFMLPIRLGTVNANGAQELFVYAITTRGRVETNNYKTVKLPSDVDVPLFVRKDFTPFYKRSSPSRSRKKTAAPSFSNTRGT